jgi:hypothetical protein
MPFPIVTGRAFRPSVKLLEQSDERPVPVEGATWIQIAAEGEYKGHPTGEFELDAKVFSEIIKNFRAHPSFELDEATGLGKEGVIPFDFHHASEEPPARVGVMGAPAQAWALDLEMRKGEAGAELWALASWLEPARSYVQQGKYKWTSVAIWPNATDPKSGKNIGFYMSSIAFTNDPFIQGMHAIAAHRSGHAVSLGLDHLLSEMKYILGLPETSTAAEVASEVGKLRAMVAPGVAPPAGVDIERLLGQVRSLLNLPKLADAETIFAEVDKLMGAVAASPPAPIGAETTSDSTMTTAAVAATKGKFMKEHLIKLARRLGIDFNEADFDDEVKLQVLAARIAGAACIKLDDAQAATKGIAAIAKALGVEDADEAVSKLTEMMAAMGDITAAMPGLAAIMEGQVKAQDEEEEEEVAATAAERGWDDGVIALAKAQRSGGVDFPKRDPKREHTLSSMATELREHQEIMGRKLEAKKAFRKQFPRDENRAPDYMTQALATQRTTDGQQPMMAAGTAGRGPQRVADPPAGGPVLDLENLPGENLVQKCEAHIRKQHPDKPYDEVNCEAVMLAREIRPKLQAAGR